jgi:hypothetical protein
MIGEKLIAAAVLAALAAGATGCAASGLDVAASSASPSQSGGGAPQAGGTAPAAAAPVLVPATSGSSEPGPSEPGPSPSTSPAVTPGADVYLAEGQDAHGTIVRAPGCASGCPLSGDGTVFLYGMTWRQWTGTQAVGTGTEEIQSCVPNCAGPQYKIPVTVTLSEPARDCATSSAPMYLWTKAAFRWPNGLPSGLRGADAPYNPWLFTALKSQLGCG